MAKERIDKLLVEKGLAPSRERARALIMAGALLVDDVAVTKAGAPVSPDAAIRVRGDDCPYVSRGGLKLAGALDDLGIDVSGKVVLDVGASTGGFTDVCLKRGAARVFAVDVGTNQLDYSLRRDPRVVSLEKTNARHLTPEALPGPADLAVIDVSFISITKILPAVAACLSPGGAVVAMVKPQFEAGREKVGKGGVVRDPDARAEAVDKVVAAAVGLGMTSLGRADARIQGPKGNQETFVHLEIGDRPLSPVSGAGTGEGG
jgi:23S rRNA (cytidine1920-2'-O)/16S rRNA (cytidine1409-2'-O)-methyltransferase